jgi:hypothetical protein
MLVRIVHPLNQPPPGVDSPPGGDSPAAADTPPDDSFLDSPSKMKASGLVATGGEESTHESGPLGRHSFLELHPRALRSSIEFSNHQEQQKDRPTEDSFDAKKSIIGVCTAINRRVVAALGAITNGVPITVPAGLALRPFQIVGGQ